MQMAAAKFNIVPPYYPIVYVRGYAMTSGERETTFYDAYYGFSATSVEKRQVPPPTYNVAEKFEGQLIRFMKNQDYLDEMNEGLEDAAAQRVNPSRSIWVCRFYDPDVFQDKIRSIQTHAADLQTMVCDAIPARLHALGVDLGPNNRDYKVILIAHSMGGLVCRTLIQNLLPNWNEREVNGNKVPVPAADRDPSRWIHRLVTIGSPHGGIDLGRVPDWVEGLAAKTVNAFDSGIFNPDVMRQYLKLEEPLAGKKKKGPPWMYDVHSLGPEDRFPIKRCLCIIGSDYSSYSAVQHVTGNHSDGLVKQDNAYVVAGPRPATNKPPSEKATNYPESQIAYWANVHRAHSGRRGIVNSYESYENIRRFLFGNIKAEIYLEGLQLQPREKDDKGKEKYDRYFYDFEFLLSIRGTGAYLHRREQDPCENALRKTRQEIEAAGTRIHLHTTFMDSSLKDPGQKFSHFAVKLRVVEHRVKEGVIWDKEYPERPVFNETLELRVGDADPAHPGDELQYRWLSDGDAWLPPEGQKPDASGAFHIPLREAASFRGTLGIAAGRWPDRDLTRDR